MLCMAPTQWALARSRGGYKSHITPVAAAVTIAATAPTVAQRQSGYWAQVTARDATVRDRPGHGGRVLKTLTYGQFFRVYPSYTQNPAWYLGYACPNGNRGCGNRESTPGFILRSALSVRASITHPTLPHTSEKVSFASILAETKNSMLMGEAQYAPALYHTASKVATTATVAVMQGQERRICARQVWMRNDKLWPIELLYAGDRFIIERYTDGSQNDGRAHWAIGRARNLRGRVLASALCR